MWALARLRSGKWLKATDIAAEFEVNVRTAYRDMDFLRDEWRVPVEFDRGKYLLTEPTTALPPLTRSLRLWHRRDALGGSAFERLGGQCGGRSR